MSDYLKLYWRNTPPPHQNRIYYHYWVVSKCLAALVMVEHTGDHNVLVPMYFLWGLFRCSLSWHSPLTKPQVPSITTSWAFAEPSSHHALFGWLPCCDSLLFRHSCPLLVIHGWPLGRRRCHPFVVLWRFSNSLKVLGQWKGGAYTEQWTYLHNRARLRFPMVYGLDPSFFCGQGLLNFPSCIFHLIPS